MKHRIAWLLFAFSLFVLSACGTANVSDPSEALQQGTEVTGPTQDFHQEEASQPAQNDSEAPDSPAMSSGEDQLVDTSQEPAQPQQPTTPVSDMDMEPPRESAVQQPSSEAAPPRADANPAKILEPEESGPRILIAYFTWAENTVVDDPSSVDVDATTSASVLAPGHVAQMANWIQAETGGDLFSIQAADLYSSDYDECLDRAADEKAANSRPALSGSVRSMADYDVVFLGYPDWWSTCPMAIFTFLDSYDFSGKTVIPFCAHGTSGLAASVRDIKAALPGVTVLDAVGVQRPGMDTSLSSAETTVKNWLAGLDY